MERMEDNDAAAIERARGGSGEAFRELVERHSHAVFRLAYRMTGNEQDAEDTVQETFLRAYRQLGRFDSRSKFGTWLYAIASNCALDLIRARKRRRESDAEPVEPVIPAADPSPERLALSREVRQRLSAAMNDLSDAERTAFVMRHFEGVSIDEIARVLGRPNGATRHSVFRAVEKLRRALEPVMSVAR
jgi:RNA polymerase sigma-70 factor (ECF subfamily)